MKKHSEGSVRNEADQINWQKDSAKINQRGKCPEDISLMNRKIWEDRCCWTSRVPNREKDNQEITWTQHNSSKAQVKDSLSRRMLITLLICLLKISKDQVSYECKAESLNSVAYKNSKVSNKIFSVNLLFAWRSLLTFHKEIGFQMLIQLMSYANIWRIQWTPNPNIEETRKEMQDGMHLSSRRRSLLINQEDAMKGSLLGDIKTAAGDMLCSLDGWTGSYAMLCLDWIGSDQSGSDRNKFETPQGVKK